MKVQRYFQKNGGSGLGLNEGREILAKERGSGLELNEGREILGHYTFVGH